MIEAGEKVGMIAVTTNKNPSRRYKIHSEVIKFLFGVLKVTEKWFIKLVKGLSSADAEAPLLIEECKNEFEKVAPSSN